MGYLNIEYIESNEVSWNIDNLVEAFSQEFKHLWWNKVLESLDVVLRDSTEDNWHYHIQGA